MDSYEVAVLRTFHSYHLAQWKEANDARDMVRANALALCVIQHLLGLDPHMSYTHARLFDEVKKLTDMVSRMHAALQDQPVNIRKIEKELEGED